MGQYLLLTHCGHFAEERNHSDCVRYRTDAGLTVNGKERRDGFLAKAKEAQEQAERTRDRCEKESWLRMAESYLALANRQEPKD